MVIVIKLVFPCAEPICVPPGSPKTYFVKSCPTVSLGFYGQKKSKNLQNLFHALLNNLINEKTDPPQKKINKNKNKNLKQSKIGGLLSRVGMTTVKDSLAFV